MTTVAKKLLPIYKSHFSNIHIMLFTTIKTTLPVKICLSIVVL